LQEEIDKVKTENNHLDQSDDIQEMLKNQ